MTLCVDNMVPYHMVVLVCVWLAIIRSGGCVFFTPDYRPHALRIVEETLFLAEGHWLQVCMLSYVVGV